jgi:DNA (cytosine-5)-methyltransferase 1
MMRLLDLFCGAGGAGMGYYQAGFEVVGVDKDYQKRYPFEFHQADALEFVAAHGIDFDVIHASPPCQFYSRTKTLKNAKDDHPDMIDATRAALVATGKPYIIENVPEAPLHNPLMLCGTMFGLGVLRHRIFETYPEIYFAPASCQHWPVESIWWKRQKAERLAGKKYKLITVAGDSFRLPEAKKAMGIDWMTRKEIAQAIPPAYTKFIGEQLLKLLEEMTNAKDDRKIYRGTIDRT